MPHRIHHSVTLDRVLPLAEESMFGMEDRGVCLVCGHDQRAEGDARRHVCDSCGLDMVFGAQEILVMGAYYDNTAN